METRRWKKPLTEKDRAEIKEVLAPLRITGEAYACINDNEQLTLIFPVLQELTEALPHA